MQNKILNSKLNLAIKLKDGRQLGYADYGDPEGKIIFYFHGFPGSRLEAAHLHDTAFKNHYRLIAIDRPGMGLSSIDPKRTILAWATDVADFANCLGIDKFSILGHSGGAPFVAACAYGIPERLNAAAIVSGMAPLDHPKSRIGMARGQIIANNLIKIIPWLTSVMMRLTRMVLNNPNKMMGQMMKQLPEVDQALFRDPEIQKALIQSTLEAFRHGITGASQEMKLLFNAWGFELEQINCPVVIWQGGVDKQAPKSHAQIYVQSIPNA